LRNLPRQHAGAGQHHFAGDQPGGSAIEEDTRAFNPQPGPRVEPAQEVEMARLIGERSIVISSPNVGGVFPVRFPDAIFGQAGRVGNLQLVGKMGDNAGWHVSGIGEEGAQNRAVQICRAKPKRE
jgi:hypothetical protein